MSTQKNEHNPDGLRTKFLDYDARREPKTKHFCIKCQRDLKPGQPFRIVHVYEGAFVVHPDGPQPPFGDVSAFPVGMDCARSIGMEWTRDPSITPPTDTTGKPDCAKCFGYGWISRPVEGIRCDCCSDTTGSGREGETVETDKQEFNESCNFDVDWPNFARQLERQRDAAIAQVEALRRDGERLVKAVARILKIDKKQGGSISTLSDEELAEVSDEIKANPEKFRTGAYRDIAEQTLAIIELRAAIDSAQRQEGA